MKKTAQGGKKGILIAFVALSFILLLSLIALLSGGLPNEINKKFLKRNGTKIEATIERVGSKGGNYKSPGVIIVLYKYTDENGVEYTGDCGWTFKTRQKAEEQIGKTVEIYIDGKGNSVSSAMPINIRMGVTIAIILGVLLCGCIVAITILSVKIAKEKKRKKQQHPQQE